MTTLPIYPITFFDTTFIHRPDLECATHIVGIGQAVSVHPLYQDMPAGIPRGPAIVEAGTRYHDVAYAVMTGAANRKGEREIAREEALRVTSLVLNWAGMRYIMENNFELISNLGADHKKKPQTRSTTATALLGAPQKIKLEHGKNSGTLRLTLGRVSGAILYIVQGCQGDPNDEAAWTIEWQFSRIKGGVELTGLEPGKVYYIRVRGRGHTGLGPWSTYVHIMAI